MKKTKKLCANLFLESAEILGIDSEIVSESRGLILLKKDGKEIFVQNNFLGVNLFTSYLIAKSKYLSHKILSKDANVPLPKMFLFNLKKQTKEAILEEVEAIKNNIKDIVIKPNDLSLGKGVFVKPESSDDILNALDKIEELGSSFVLVEEFIEGSDYRIILFDGECLGIVKRIHANVIGDGILTIQDLIKKKNKLRNINGFKSINIDDDMHAFLNDQNKDIYYIPKAGEKIILRKVCNFSQGGETQNVDIETINPKYFEIFNIITKLSQLRFIGVDLITKDITVDPFENSSGINEINAHPQLDVNHYADVLDNIAYNTINRVLKKVFELN